ncbi:MAG: Uroporphyrin-III C/tetrapyrrole (Corrin/Porphyrin) methyltransferase, partial [Lacunisphaera sp.]|nr:Uroporphyrin-III C/tetrapyrrole (Corrin/Porphyrin) methyltransferase [Lacunisphaera sp.]
AATLAPDRVVCLAKEHTKNHDPFLVGGAADVEARLAKMSLKGEFVVLIAPRDFVL